MKLSFIKRFFIPFLIVLCLPLVSQKINPGSKSQKKYPTSFQISKAEIDDLLLKKAKDEVKSSNNKYIDKSTVLMNVLNGDTRFVRIKLNYFTNAFLTIQVNGIYSTQVFILSENKSVSYKGNIQNGNAILIKCNEDDIVSE